MVQGLRMVKSESEIEKLAHICGIGSRAFGQVPNLMSEGQPLEDVFRTFRIAALQEGADDAPYVVGAADQGGYADVISPPNQRPLQKGDVLMLDTEIGRLVMPMMLPSAPMTCFIGRPRRALRPPNRAILAAICSWPCRT